MWGQIECSAAERGYFIQPRGAGESACFGGGIFFRLCFKHFRVPSAERHKLLMCSLLREATAVKDVDAVGAACGGEAVRDAHDCLIRAEAADISVYFVFRFGVERCGGSSMRMSR